jgi:hypothetical protein
MSSGASGSGSSHAKVSKALVHGNKAYFHSVRGYYHRHSALTANMVSALLCISQMCSAEKLMWQLPDCSRMPQMSCLGSSTAENKRRSCLSFRFSSSQTHHALVSTPPRMFENCFSLACTLPCGRDLTRLKTAWLNGCCAMCWRSAKVRSTPYSAPTSHEYGQVAHRVPSKIEFTYVWTMS